jgi:hypothetical protein
MDDSPWDRGISSAKNGDVSLILVQEGSLRTEGQNRLPTNFSIPYLVAGGARAACEECTTALCVLRAIEVRSTAAKLPTPTSRRASKYLQIHPGPGASDCRQRRDDGTVVVGRCSTAERGFDGRSSTLPTSKSFSEESEYTAI